MPNPLTHDVLLNLQTTLQAISVAGGYHFDVDDDAVSLDPDKHIELLTGSSLRAPFYIIEAPPGRRFDYHPANQLRQVLTVNVTGAHEATPLQPQTKLLRYEQLCADVERAVAVDHTRGGLATDTRVMDQQMGVIVGGQRVLAIIELEVRLYRTFGSPNNG